MPEKLGNNQEQSTLNYFSKLGFNLIDAIVKRFSDPQTARRNRFILLISTAILLTLIILPDQHFSRHEFNIGDIATSDIRAAHDYLVEDQALTELKRKEAGAAAPVVYSLSDRVPSYITDKLTQSLAIIRKENSRGTEHSNAEWNKLLSPIFDTELSASEIRALAAVKNDKLFLGDALKRLSNIYRNYIVLDNKVFQTDIKRGLEIHDNNGNLVGTGRPETPVTEISDTRKLVTTLKFAGTAKPEDAQKIGAVISRIMLPNLFFSQEATTVRSQSAMEVVKPVMFKIQKGEMIVRTGERITPDQVRKLKTIFHESDDKSRVITALGVFIMVLVLFYCPYRFACKNIRKFNPTNKDILVLSLLVTGCFFVYKTALMISQNIGPVFPYIEPRSYFYLLPFAAAPMIVRVLLNSEVALVFCAILAPPLGFMLEDNMFLVVYALLGGIVGAHGMRQCTDRSTIYVAGLKVSFVNLALAISFQAFNNTLFSMQTIYASMFAVISGILSSVLASGLIPVIEVMFNYTTDIKLLELANLNSPLLRELMLKAPGTYHHSVMVGNLVEGAAEAVNANPLLARVAAYYHDIGKVSKPLYFIENQSQDDNRHDKLTPSMSALILISHIKEGVEMAREKHVGQPIIDIIRQHHGTALIKFFYERAKAQSAISGAFVEEQEFRYPGPKPQTREAGIVMLADCVEAASRTLINPTPDRIQGMVQTLINRVFIDGQLDECELTLKNLHEIAKSFNRTLNAIFHHRIDYPEPIHKHVGSKKQSQAKPAQQKPTDNIKTAEGGHTSADHAEQSTEAPQHHAQPPKKSGAEDIKRLGIS